MIYLYLDAAVRVVYHGTTVLTAVNCQTQDKYTMAISTTAKPENGTSSSKEEVATKKNFYEEEENLTKLCNFLRSKHGPPVRNAVMMDKRVLFLKGKSRAIEYRRYVAACGLKELSQISYMRVYLRLLSCYS